MARKKNESIKLTDKTSQLLVQLSQNAAIARQRLGDAINATVVALEIPDGYRLNQDFTAFEAVEEKAGE